LRPVRRELQMVFQDPYASLNPRNRVGTIIGDPLRIHGIADGAEAKRQVQELMQVVGLSPEHYNRYQHEFSGGQRQRIGVARALALKPKLIVADEPVSALDVSIQAQVVNLLCDLKAELGLTMLFISHDLRIVRQISERVAVMYLGRLVEVGDADDIFASARHPYTRALVSASPMPGRRATERIVLSGDPPNPAARPSGCAFHPRCPLAIDRCRRETPQLSDVASGRRVACHLVGAGAQPPEKAAA